MKSPFTFNIFSPLPVIASGIHVKEDSVTKDDLGNTLYKFKQDVPIPSYLFALASGLVANLFRDLHLLIIGSDIFEAPIGPRSLVATGPEELKDCQWEFEADTERFLKAAEAATTK